MGLVDYGLVDGTGTQIDVSLKVENPLKTKKIVVSRYFLKE